LLLTFLALVALPLVNIVRGNHIEYRPFAFAIPTFSLFNLNIYSKLALDALTNFKYIAILASESKSPARNIGRSVVIAAPRYRAHVHTQDGIRAYLRPSRRSRFD